MQGWSARQLSLVLTTRVHSPALTWLVHFLQRRAGGRADSAFPSSSPQGWISQIHTFGANSTVLSSRGVKGTLCSAAADGGRDSSPTLKTSGPSLPPVLVGEGHDILYQPMPPQDRRVMEPPLLCPELFLFPCILKYFSSPFDQQVDDFFFFFFIDKVS